VPGGGVEQDETYAETAVREILEEAGVVGRLGRCLGVFEVRIDGIIGYEKLFGVVHKLC
jgi:8-oxo-dGTP pyrophosphatase MutT (NUDIX family)